MIILFEPELYLVEETGELLTPQEFEKLQDKKEEPAE